MVNYIFQCCEELGDWGAIKKLSRSPSGEIWTDLNVSQMYLPLYMTCSIRDVLNGKNPEEIRNFINEGLQDKDKKNILEVSYCSVDLPIMIQTFLKIS